MDPHSEALLALVNPDLAAKVRAAHVEFMRRTAHIFRVTSGLRTYAEQDALYEQGRTKPGKIVTNARGGYSNHNFGCAVDVVPNTMGANPFIPDWDVSHSTWPVMIECMKAQGLSWGGDWKSITDKPHFQLANVPATPTAEDRAAFAAGGLEAVWALYRD